MHAVFSEALHVMSSHENVLNFTKLLFLTQQEVHVLRELKALRAAYLPRRRYFDDKHVVFSSAVAEGEESKIR